MNKWKSKLIKNCEWIPSALPTPLFQRLYFHKQPHTVLDYEPCRTLHKDVFECMSLGKERLL